MAATSLFGPCRFRAGCSSTAIVEKPNSWTGSVLDFFWLTINEKN